MDTQTEKCVLVIDGTLPLGLIANTAAILGITALPVPILRADRQTLRALRRKLYEPCFAGLTAVDFSDLAQGCGTYSEFTRKAAATPEEELSYFGIGICGAKKLVGRLTGNLPLLR